MSAAGATWPAAASVCRPIEPSTSAPVSPIAGCRIMADRPGPAFTPWSKTIRSTPAGSRRSACGSSNRRRRSLAAYPSRCSACRRPQGLGYRRNCATCRGDAVIGRPTRIIGIVGGSSFLLQGERQRGGEGIGRGRALCWSDVGMNQTISAVTSSSDFIAAPHDIALDRA